MSYPNEDNSLSFAKEIQLLWQKRYWIIGVTVGAALLAFVVTLPSIIPPKYLSQAAFVPPRLDDLARTNALHSQKQSSGIATDKDLDRFAGLLNSDSVKRYMAQRFDLYKVYEIDVANPKSRDKQFNKAYDKHIQASVSKWSVVAIEVYDHDAKRAQAIAKAHLEYADSMAKDFAKNRTGYKALIQQIAQTETEIDSLEAEVSELRTRYGIFQLDNLSDVATSSMQPKLMSKDFKAHYDRHLVLKSKLFGLAGIYNNLIKNKKALESRITMHPQLITVITEPTDSHAVKTPNRLLTVVLTFLGALLLSIFAVVLFDKPKRA